MQKALIPVAQVLHHFIVPNVDIYNNLKGSAEFHLENCKSVKLDKVPTYETLVTYLTKVDSGASPAPDQELAEIIGQYFTNLHAKYGQELLEGVQLEAGLPLEAALPWADIDIVNLTEPTVEAFFDTTKIPASAEDVAEAVKAAVEGEKVPVTAEVGATNEEAVQDQPEDATTEQGAEDEGEAAADAEGNDEAATQEAPTAENLPVASTATENLPAPAAEEGLNAELVKAVTTTVGVLETSVKTNETLAKTNSQLTELLAQQLGGKTTVAVKADDAAEVAVK